MSLKEYRAKIDQLDERIVKTLNERAKLSQKIGELKNKEKRSIYSAEREQQVLKRVKDMNAGPMTGEALDAIYREIMSASLSLEKALRIAYMGPKASFSHQAALKKFGSQVEYVDCLNISEVFKRVSDGDCDHGVVPIENSIEGAVTHTFDLLVDSDLKICSQLLLEISHNLLSKTTLSKIKNVYSNPHVFGQCRYWLQNNLPQANLIDVVSTTHASQIATKEKNSAAIASILAAKEYNLKVVQQGIEDSHHNITRFLVIANSDVPQTGNDRTSIVFSIRDRVGALHDMLTPFHENKINLTKIESRPSKKKAWDYYFFVDFYGHREDAQVKKALQKLDGMCKYLKVLGSYPV
jgi:chorismate mutase/prephenate dehydratase